MNAEIVATLDEKYPAPVEQEGYPITKEEFLTYIEEGETLEDMRARAELANALIKLRRGPRGQFRVFDDVGSKVMKGERVQFMPERNW